MVEAGESGGDYAFKVIDGSHPLDILKEIADDEKERGVLGDQ